MTPERWARIKEICGAALDLAADERPAYLAEACAGDDALREEVERLLAEQSASTLPSPAHGLLARAASLELAPGDMLAHYRVEAKLGEGGMGAVYRAYDTRLQRQVALKVLAGGQLADPAGRQRLLREARAASALNHPGIVTVHEIGEDRGVDFIAMEYVEGRPLSHLIPRGGLPAKRALEYAVEIAGALAHAHSAGVVHRDLKPANVMVAKDGRVKLVDFGLARRVRLEEGKTGSLTLEGQIAGTPAYMAPEQVEGRKTNERTDVFAFGAMLYEMLSGRRAFAGDSTASVMGAVLREDPPPLAGVPRDLDRVVRMCLRKDPARRLQHMDDVKLHLEALKEEADSAAPAPAKRRPCRRLVAAATAAVLAAALGLGLWLRFFRPRDSTPGLTRLTSDSGLTFQPAISPDGMLLAYASDRGGAENLDIWVQHTAGGAPIRLTSDPAVDSDPAFSPDSAQIAFRSEREGGGIYVVPALGGDARLVAPGGRNPRFSPDGSQIAYWVGAPAIASGGALPAAVFVVPSRGGHPRRIQPEFRSARLPIWTPDGKHLLFTGMRNTEEDFDWWVAPVAGGDTFRTGARKTLMVEVHVPNAWLREGVLYSVESGDATNLWILPISARNWLATGPPRALTFGAGNMADPSVSAAGQVVFAAVSAGQNVWSVPIHADQGRVTGELQRLTHGPTPHRHPALSRDGRYLAYEGGGSAWGTFRVRELDTGKETTISPGAPGNNYSTFNPDGSKVLLGGQYGQQCPFFVAPARGGVPEKVCEVCGNAPHWSASGRHVVYDWGVPRYVGVLELSSGARTQILRHPGQGVLQAQLSPDDRWISFALTTGAGNTRLMAAPFRGMAAIPEAEWTALTEGASFDVRPRWSPDGNLLYFASNRDGFFCIWAQRLDPATKRPLGAPFAVRHFHNHRQLLMGPPYLGLGVAPGRMIFNMLERTGNIWTFRLPEGP